MKDLTSYLNESLEVNETIWNVKLPTGKSVDPQNRDQIIDITRGAMRSGYFILNHEEYGVSAENIYDLFDESLISREDLENLIKTLEKQGIEWKYKKNKDIPRKFKEFK